MKFGVTTIRNLLGLLVLAGMLCPMDTFAKGKAPKARYYTVLPGDTLDGIAVDLGVTVEELIEWNGDDVGELFVGRHILFRGLEKNHLRARAMIEVKQGSSLASLGEKYDLTEVQMRVLNPQYGEAAVLDEGEEVLVLAPVRSRRHGVDADGKTFWSKIRDPEWLGEKGVGYCIKNRRNVWGSVDTIELLKTSFRRVALSFPGTAPFVVGDISLKRGGSFFPHLSHKTGMDIDLSFAFRDNLPRKRFEVARPSTMDAEKTWEFMRAILETGHTQYIFVDYKLQKPLYQQALASGISRELLEEVFQYPRSRHTKKGIIRHTRGHSNHMHIRFDFKREYLSNEAMDALKRSGDNPIVQLNAWVQDIFA